MHVPTSDAQGWIACGNCSSNKECSLCQEEAQHQEQLHDCHREPRQTPVQPGWMTVAQAWTQGHVVAEAGCCSGWERRAELCLLFTLMPVHCIYTKFQCLQNFQFLWNLLEARLSQAAECAVDVSLVYIYIYLHIWKPRKEAKFIWKHRNYHWIKKTPNLIIHILPDRLLRLFQRDKAPWAAGSSGFVISHPNIWNMSNI